MIYHRLSLFLFLLFLISCAKDAETIANSEKVTDVAIETPILEKKSGSQVVIPPVEQEPEIAIPIELKRVCSISNSLSAPMGSFFEEAKWVLKLTLTPRSKAVLILANQPLDGVDLRQQSGSLKIRIKKKNIPELSAQSPGTLVGQVCRVKAVPSANDSLECANKVEPVTVRSIEEIEKGILISVLANRFSTLKDKNDNRFKVDPKACDSQASPLVIDMAGKGIKLSSPQDGVWFDLRAEGELIRTGWVQNGSEAAFLALDINRNGKIDDGGELFGNATTLNEGDRALNGFLALAQYDSNGDGQISLADGIWKQLRLWFDRNHDGIAQAAEVDLLSESGVLSIDLAYQFRLESDSHGNETRQRSIARTVYGNRLIADIWFNTLEGN